MDDPPPGNRKGRKALHHSASGPVNQIKRNPNQPRITKSENVSSRVRGLQLQNAVLRGLEVPLGRLFWSIVERRARIETEISRLPITFFSGPAELVKNLKAGDALTVCAHLYGTEFRVDGGSVKHGVQLIADRAFLAKEASAP
jgi:hypothetical protein